MDDDYESVPFEDAGVQQVTYVLAGDLEPIPYNELEA